MKRIILALALLVLASPSWAARRLIASVQAPGVGTWIGAPIDARTGVQDVLGRVYCLPADGVVVRARAFAEISTDYNPRTLVGTWTRVAKMNTQQTSNSSTAKIIILDEADRPPGVWVRIGIDASQAPPTGHTVNAEMWANNVVFEDDRNIPQENRTPAQYLDTARDLTDPNG